jgi:hypothetical protein
MTQGALLKNLTYLFKRQIAAERGACGGAVSLLRLPALSSSIQTQHLPDFVNGCPVAFP